MVVEISNKVYVEREYRVHEMLGGNTRVAVMSESVALGASVNLARALLAANVPNASNRIAVLAFTEEGTATAVVKVRHRVNTFVATAGQRGHCTCRQTLRANTDSAGAKDSLIVATMSPIMSPVISSTWVGGGSRGLVGSGGGVRTTPTGAARVGGFGPVPAMITLRRWKLMGWLMRDTAAPLYLPGPIGRALAAFRRVNRLRRSSIIKTAALGLPPKL